MKIIRNITVEILALMLSILKVPALILGPEAGYSDSPPDFL
jgi:hypothetical protein